MAPFRDSSHFGNPSYLNARIAMAATCTHARGSSAVGGAGDRNLSSAYQCDVLTGGWQNVFLPANVLKA